MPLCPHCSRQNERWVAAEIVPGERFPVAPNPCEHYVFASIAKEPSGADYAHEVLYMDIYNNNPSGRPGTEVSAGILEILQRYLDFADGMGFARSEVQREAARGEVSRYLHSLGFAVPDPRGQ